MAGLTDTDIRDIVRERYAASATSIAGGAAAVDSMAEPTSSSCYGMAATAGSSRCAPVSLQDADGNEVFGGSRYDAVDGAGDAPVQASLGCGVPDRGSGAGADVLISARRVTPSGRAIGLNMTDEMLQR